MSPTARSSSPGDPPPQPDRPTSARALDPPSRRERRLDDLLAALDPQPLVRLAARPLAPARGVIETLVEPLAAGLEAGGRLVGGLWAGALATAGTLFGALPLPAVVRRALWLGKADFGSLAEGTAQAALKRQHSIVFPLSLMAAVGVHAGVLVFSPRLNVADFAPTSEELLALELPPEVEIPPPPQELIRPATPVIASATIDEDITIAPTTFDDYTVADLPPPPAQTVEETPEPTFTPFTVAPRVLNVDLIEELMKQEYPPLLRDAGIGGIVVVWAFISREGIVEEVRVARSSGHVPLDEAGLVVARRIRTSPALNRDVTVPVWIQLPLEFEVR